MWILRGAPLQTKMSRFYVDFRKFLQNQLFDVSIPPVRRFGSPFYRESQIRPGKRSCPHSNIPKCKLAELICHGRRGPISRSTVSIVNQRKYNYLSKNHLLMSPFCMLRLHFFVTLKWFSLKGLFPYTSLPSEMFCYNNISHSNRSCVKTFERW